jgi:hypothetical protein
VASGKTVYFSWWDIDDPSSDPTIDTNGSVGGDNLGSGESLSASSATTNASGEAKVVFTVSMQPGDNFKIAASTCSARLNETTQTMVDNDNLPRSVKLSPTLTTWRKLHLERDSMVIVATSGPEDNWLRGGIDTGSVDYDPVADETEVALHQDLADCWEETKQYHFFGGKFHVGISYDALRTISHVGDDEIVVDGNCSIGWPMSYWLKDDDHTNLLPDLLDMGKLNSIFDDCYITCDDNASGGAENVAFERNVGGAWTDASEVKDVADRGSAAEEDDAWWVVYILTAYQPGYSEDNDPTSESCSWGLTEGIDSQVSIILLESSDDVANEKGVSSGTFEQQTVVHEIGHQVLEEMDSAHTVNTIMSAMLPVDAQYEKFSPSHIREIREDATSPGW